MFSEECTRTSVTTKRWNNNYEVERSSLMDEKAYFRKRKRVAKATLLLHRDEELRA
jgi:hypothetical protein